MRRVCQSLEPARRVPLSQLRTIDRLRGTMGVDGCVEESPSVGISDGNGEPIDDSSQIKMMCVEPDGCRLLAEQRFNGPALPL